MNIENRTTRFVEELFADEIFVFGSNLQGHHGKGAAKTAKRWGAKRGQADGLMGRTYGIPTKGMKMNIILPISKVKSYVDDFVEFAKLHPEMKFLVTEVGCGLAKGGDNKRHELIAPLFVGAVHLENVSLPKKFWDVLAKQKPLI